MAFNQANGGAGIVAAARLMLGHDYVLGGAHDWEPGEPTPAVGDCSGSTHFATGSCGCDVGPGNAETQWQNHLGGIIAPSFSLAPGDIGAFLGSANIAGYADHIAVVDTYDPFTRLGTIIGEYDRALGDVILPFDRNQFTNAGRYGHNGLGVLGFFRPANTLPPAPKPPAPLPPPPPPPPAADAYAKAHGMVRIDVAEARMAITVGISYYIWVNESMRGSRGPSIPTNITLFAFAANLDKVHIPHAGP